MTVAQHVADFFDGKRKNVNDSNAAFIASLVSGDINPAIRTFTLTGAIPSVDKLRTEINAIANEYENMRRAWSQHDWEIYAFMIALDCYVCQWRRSRQKPARWSNPFAVAA